MVAVEALRPLRQALRARANAHNPSKLAPIDSRVVVLRNLHPQQHHPLHHFHQGRPAVAGALPQLSPRRAFSSTPAKAAKVANDDEEWCPSRDLKRWWAARAAAPAPSSSEEQHQPRQGGQAKQTGWGRGMFASSSSFGWQAAKSPFHRYHQPPPSSSAPPFSADHSILNPDRDHSRRSLNVHVPNYGICSAVLTANSHAYACHGLGHHHHAYRRSDAESTPSSSSSSSSSPHSHERQQHHHDPSSRPFADSFTSSNHPDSGAKPPPPPSDDCSAGWGWYLALNERRRRDPGKRRHFRHAMKTLGVEGDCGSFLGAQGRERACEVWRERWRFRKSFKGREGREAWHKLEKQIKMGKAKAVLAFREAAMRSSSSPSASSHHSHSHSHHHSSSSSSTLAFDFESLRASLWYTRYWLTPSRLRRRAPTATPEFRKGLHPLWHIRKAEMFKKPLGAVGTGAGRKTVEVASSSSSKRTCREQSSAGAEGAKAGSGGGGKSGANPKIGGFDYESFRASLWYARYSRMRRSRFRRHFHSQPHLHMPLHRRRRPSFISYLLPHFRDSDPKAWVRHVHSRRRNKTGLAYFSGRYAPKGCQEKGRYAEGAIGGAKVALGKPPVKGEKGMGSPNHCYLHRNEVTARLASQAGSKRAAGGGAAAGRSPPLYALNRLALSRFPPVPTLLSSSSPARIATFCSPSPSPSPPSARTFSTSRPSCGLHLLLPLASALKSTTALNLLTTLTRLSLTLLPLSLRGKVFATLRARYAADPASLASTVFGRAALRCASAEGLARPGGVLERWNAVVGLPLLLAAPVVMLLLVVVASVERTPVTGRWRVVMLSPAEEGELINSVLSSAPAVAPSLPSSPSLSTSSSSPAAATPALTPEGTSLDWVTILRRVLHLPDEGLSPSGTRRRMLLGGEVLDPRDWRVRWAEAVLRALEKGGERALTGEGGGEGKEGVMSPPPTGYPLTPRASQGHGKGEDGWRDELVLSKHLPGIGGGGGGDGANPLRVEYDLLVIDRPDTNAFSFGFGPDQAKEGEGRRGVIVVYTGFIESILNPSPSSSSLPSFSSFSSPGSLPPTPPYTPPPSPSLLPRLSPQDHIAQHLTPSTLPTQAQTKALAVLLSHELAHLCLDHTLEAYASTSLVVPHLMRLGSDVLRTVLYPLTFFLGPFLNDALGKTLHEGAQGGFGVVGKAVNSCESRRLEGEADRVALRLLAASGIDPFFAISFWQDRLSTPPSSSSSHSSHSHSHSHPPTIKQHDSTGVVDGLLRSHPVDEERVEGIKAELEGWRRWWEKHPVRAPVPSMV